MDDIYIYHAYTLSLLLACLQNKHRRGRLYFQEREDDVDMVISDSPNYPSREHVYQVNSMKYYNMFYSVNRDKNTSHIFVSCQIAEKLYKPKVKMRRIHMCVHVAMHVRVSQGEETRRCVMHACVISIDRA